MRHRKLALVSFFVAAFATGTDPVSASDPTSDAGGDFRLPASGAKGAIPAYSKPGLRTLFWERNGPGWVVYWDEELETPRFLAPRTRLAIARPEMVDQELSSAVRDFVERNTVFFGVSAGDLLNPTVTALNRHRLVGFVQGHRGVAVRGAGLRVLIDPEGSIASVDSFLVRSSSLAHLPEPEWLDENALLKKAHALSGGELGALKRQVLFPASDPGSAVAGYCLEAEEPDGRSSELFFAAGGAYLGEWDLAQYFAGKGVAEWGDKCFEGKTVVRGFSTDPNDIYSTADHANDYYPIPGALVFVGTGWRAMTEDDGTAIFYSPQEEDNVWPALSFGFYHWEPEGCLDGVQFEGVIDEGKNQDGIKSIAMLHAKPRCEHPGNKEPPIDLFDPALRVPVDVNQPVVFTFEDDPNRDPRLDRLTAFDLLAYHHVRRLHLASSERIVDNKLEAAVRDNFPLRVIVNSLPENYWAPQYVGFDCQARICIGQKMGRQSWVPPTLVHHEYAHHVIRTLVGTNQGDGFVEGLADVITAFANGNPRIGYIGENAPGTVGFRIDDEDFILSKDQRLRTRAIFWEIREQAEVPQAQKTISDLLYVWMGHRYVSTPDLLAFDPEILLEQLLVADAALSGSTRVDRKPPRGDLIIQAFRERPIFYTPFIRGDVDRSGGVDLTDAVAALNYLFLGGSEDRCLDAMDVDDSSHLDLSDPLRILNHLFLGGEAPVEPFPYCGWDPTDLDLWCSETAAACRDL